MAAKYVIGVDLGGTKILTALSDTGGDIKAKVLKDTEADKGKEVVIDNLKYTVYKVVEEAGVNIEDVAGVGLGVPGPINIEAGIIQHTPNLDLDNVNIIKRLAGLDLPIFLENDANAAALGEKYFGAGINADDLLYVTVSTGIGGGIVIGGQVFHGSSNGAGEVGHMTILPDSKNQCGCGNYGCWEAIASGTAIKNRAQEAIRAGKDSLMKEMVSKIDDINGEIVTQAYKEGDELAREIISEVGEYLGIGFSNLINIFNPEIIVIGGGVSSAWSLFDEQVEKSIKQRAMSPLAEDVELVITELGSEVGVYGAIATALVNLDLI